MKQLLLEIDETTEAKINAAAKTAGLSTQQWLRRIIDEKTATGWPKSIKALAGTWQDAPFAEELRAAEGQDIAREDF
ncbi:hypothetical protein NP590_16710 [Methylomonas sp. SURF-2]|uniref:CopG family transcriptional regulator n=1 Tax=Methylomonas subterranea TaxID=2952225 RepID=A0ABT1TKK4_9GAMM|nr:hypothetical protein [Methylomonas sp. SURF-2]MCQ8105753.1 hypothetical protein [Methylomonas sp. SURF-2]